MTEERYEVMQTGEDEELGIKYWAVLKVLPEKQSISSTHNGSTRNGCKILSFEKLKEL